jgi:hypothetical protein
MPANLSAASTHSKIAFQVCGSVELAGSPFG